MRLPVGATGREPGFTLVEVLIASAILGILATMALRLYHDARDRSVLAVVQHDLKALAVQQELFFGEHGKYAVLDSLADFVASPEVEISITDASAAGWAARANHRTLPGQSCVIYVGNAVPEIPGLVSSPGEIGCSR